MIARHLSSLIVEQGRRYYNTVLGPIDLFSARTLHLPTGNKDCKPTQDVEYWTSPPSSLAKATGGDTRERARIWTTAES
jgi:hypothetical protein